MTKIGIITALKAEASCLTGKKPTPGIALDLNQQLVLTLSGMGEDNVGRAIESLLAKNVGALISFGTAGALDGNIKSGDIIVPENIISTIGHKQNISSSWHKKVIQNLDNCPATVHTGDMVTSATIIEKAADKQVLRESSDAIAVDMESALITNAAREHKLQSLVIRVAVDEADMTIPYRVIKCTDAYGQVALPTLLASIFRQPSLIRELLKLASAFKASNQTMQWIGQHAEQVLTAE